MDWQAWLSRVDTFINARLFDLGDTVVTPATLFAALAIALVTFWLSRLAERGVARAFRARRVLDEGSVGAAGRLVYYVVAITGLAVALHTLGVRLSGLFAAGAIFAVGIGFGLQNLVQNFVSGVILLGERAIKPGDILEVTGELVRVEHMGLRATIARTLDDEDIILPNSMLVQSSVTNLTLRDRLHRLRTLVGVVYSSDLDLVFETLIDAAESHVGRSQKRDPVVLLVGFGSSSVDFEVSVWLDDPWRVRSERSKLNLLIWKALKAKNIVIAFPQLDVHFDREAMAAWERESS